MSCTVLNTMNKGAYVRKKSVEKSACKTAFPGVERCMEHRNLQSSQITLQEKLYVLLHLRYVINILTL